MSFLAQRWTREERVPRTLWTQLSMHNVMYSRPNKYIYDRRMRSLGAVQRDWPQNANIPQTPDERAVQRRPEFHQSKDKAKRRDVFSRSLFTAISLCRLDHLYFNEAEAAATVGASLISGITNNGRPPPAKYQSLSLCLVHRWLMEVIKKILVRPLTRRCCCAAVGEKDWCIINFWTYLISERPNGWIIVFDDELCREKYNHKSIYYFKWKWLNYTK